MEVLLNVTNDQNVRKVCTTRNHVLLDSQLHWYCFLVILPVNKISKVTFTDETSSKLKTAF